ncbi:hypothetical protein [Escherichia coli]|uniref:hypothetical protein n=1 Tax=Escherichia coli TaxID=562 RepID=UPI0018364A4F|nr:hypothetical protein [Escherichia coli]EFM7837651.1 hypothetical protein [Escherichia coli]EJX1069132.1 hypothetical protein [Escherichia coli]EJY2457406.1 hypothetical protein [Escherichia coli]EKQ3788510.1 hypothetical protein [Escherichia coli]EKQ3818272.1 hypothetical protein [Escherichia coli]
MSDFLGHIINLELISRLHYVFILTQTPTHGVTAYICGALYETNKKKKHTKQKSQNKSIPYKNI